jgi:hypothetical protein
MTLHEIEETVHTLASRHKGLDEGMLITLLRAGGWEEKEIEEGKAVFRLISRASLTKSPMEAEQGKKEMLPAIADVGHMISEHAEPDAVHESLVLPSAPLQKTQENRDDLPHNLPLRPFETSEHIWPFSRYKDVFYGEMEIPQAPAIQPVSSPPKVETPPEEIVQRIVPKKIEKKIEEPASPPVAHIAPAKLSGGDEKLVITATIMLVLVLVLLGYMYSNGRL